MELKVDSFDNEIDVVTPRLELYAVRDNNGKPCHGLAVLLDCKEGVYACVTVSFGTYIRYKNAAYIDTNNCPWAEKLLTEAGVAKKTSRTYASGFCAYPLYVFDEKFLREIGEENYETYLRDYEQLAAELAANGKKPPEILPIEPMPNSIPQDY